MSRRAGAHAPHRILGLALLLAVLGALLFGAFNGPSLSFNSAHAEDSPTTEGDALGTWGIRTSYRNYVTSVVAQGQIVASDGAVWLDGTGTGKGPFTWPVTSATYDASTGTGEIQFAGSVYTSGHDGILESTWSNPRLVINGTTGTLYADLAFRPFVSIDPDPVPDLQTADNAAFGTVDLSGVDWTPDEDGLITITAAPLVGITAAMQLIGWDLFYPTEMPNPALDPLSVTFLPQSEPEPAPAVTVVPNTDADPAGQDFTVSGTGFNPAGVGIYVAFGPSPDILGETWFTDAAQFQRAVWVHAGATPSAGQQPMTAEGTFSFDMSGVVAQYSGGGNEWDCNVVQCGFLTMAAHGSTDRSQDTFTPVTFAEPAVVWEPKIELSKSTDINPAGEVITVTGSGFDPAANIGTRPPFSGQAAGVYVIFGTFADTWRPSDGAASSTRHVIQQKWAVPPAVWATVGGTNPQYVQLNADGTFTAQLTITPDAAASGDYAVVTYAGSGAVNADQELYEPITFDDSATSISDVIPDAEDIDPGVTPVSAVADDGDVVTLGDSLVTATFDDPAGGSGKVLLAKYADGAAPGSTALGLGDTVYDVHFAPTSTTGPAATLTVNFTGLAASQPLVYWDGDSWETVVSNDGAAVSSDASGNATVVFGPDSTPTLVGLGGTPVGTQDEGSEPTPSVVVAPNTDADPAGQDFTVDGSGFSPTGTGIYLAFGPDPALNPDTFSTNAGLYQKVVWLNASALLPDGEFEQTLAGVTAVYTDGDDNVIDCHVISCGIVTMKAHGVPDRTQDTFTPVTFAEPAPAATVAIAFDDASVVAGSQTTAQVTVSSDTPVAGLQFSFAFDPTVLQVASITGTDGWSTINCAPEGDPEQCLVQIDNTAGTVTAVFLRVAPQTPVSGDAQPVATITFNAIAASDGVSLDLASAALSTVDGGAIAPVALLDSDELLVEPPAPELYFISGMVLLQGRTDHSGTTVYFGGQSATTSATGAFVIEVEEGTTGTLVAIHDGYLRALGAAITVNDDVTPAQVTLRGGDATGDGAVDIFDLALIAGQYGTSGPWALGDGALTPSQTVTPDINGVDGVNLFDLTIAAGNYGLAAPSTWA